MSDSNTTTLKYSGSVTMKIKKNGKIVTVTNGHNGGTIYLSKLFSMLMSGYTKALQYIPSYVDLQYRDENSSDPWVSYLKREVAISAPSYYSDGSISPANWVYVATASIPFGLLSSAVTEDSPYEFRLCLLSDDIESSDLGGRDLAYFTSIQKEELSKIEEGSQAIIEWKMQLLYDVEE